MNGTGLVPYSKATEVASAYDAATKRIAELVADLGVEFGKLDSAFAFESETYGAFKCKIQYGNHRDSYCDCDDKGIANLMTHFNRAAWKILIEKLQISKLMSAKRRDSLYAQLMGEQGPNGKKAEPLPEINEDSIMDVLTGFLADAPSYLEESIRETYEWLIPRQNNGPGRYVTNKKDRIGKKVILAYICENWLGRVSVNCRAYGKLTALDSVFHSLDGKGILSGHNGPLVDAMRTCGSELKGETEYFAFSLKKNGNAHVEFLRPDLVDIFNQVAADGKSLSERKAA